MYVTKNPKVYGSHSYRNVHDRNPYTKKWIVICTEMCMTKTHIQRNGQSFVQKCAWQQPIRIWIFIRTEMCMTKTHMNMDSHVYRNVHDKNPYTIKWIVIRTELCMTKTHTKRIWIFIRTEMWMTKTHTQINGYSFVQKCAWQKPIQQEMDSHLYRNVYDENPYNKNMGSHSYRNVHDENPYFIFSFGLASKVSKLTHYGVV